LATAAARPQPLTTVSRSDTTAQHQSTVGAAKTDARIFRHTVREICICALFCNS